MWLKKEILRRILFYEFKLGINAAEATRRIYSAFEETSVNERLKNNLADFRS